MYFADSASNQTSEIGERTSEVQATYFAPKILNSLCKLLEEQSVNLDLLDEPNDTTMEHANWMTIHYDRAGPPNWAPGDAGASVACLVWEWFIWMTEMAKLPMIARIGGTDAAKLEK